MNRCHMVPQGDLPSSRNISRGDCLGVETGLTVGREVAIIDNETRAYNADGYLAVLRHGCLNVKGRWAGGGHGGLSGWILPLRQKATHP